jgi:1,6-anhydro-N-acetylmuramate kinase
MAQPDRHRWIAGCMTGTSLDGLDVVLARVTGTGLAATAQFVAMLSFPLGELAPHLASLAKNEPHPAIDFLRTARALGQLHADALAQLCAQHLPPSAQLDFVVAHGQTICHAPHENLSFQLLDPWPIVRQLRVPVCYDLRQADLLAGGEGAPITPLADWILYRHRSIHRCVINLGGICNVTSLPPNGSPSAVTGSDIGPCNLLLDALVHRLLPHLPFDRDGAIAAQGQPRQPIIEQLQHAIAAELSTQNKSLGREQFGSLFIDRCLAAPASTATPQDILACAVEIVSRMIAEKTCPNGKAVQLIAAGGGANNRYLLERLAANLPASCSLLRSDELAIPAQAREALAFTVLGALSCDGVPITLPQVTGASQPGRAGAWVYP